MSRDAEDDDHTTFFQLGRGGQAEDCDGPILSRAAFQLHSFAIMTSVQEGHPGFVPDDYLNSIAAETTVTAAELCMAGFWERVEDGYQVIDREMLDMAIDADKRITDMMAACLKSGGHFADPERPQWCSECGSRISDDEDEDST
jgi:hypothetical protein